MSKCRSLYPRDVVRKAIHRGSETLFRVLIQTFEEIADERSDLVGRLIEGEVSSFQKVDFGGRYIVGIGCRTGDGERGIIFSPNHQRRRLYVAKPRLPTRIGGDVGPVIQE